MIILAFVLGAIIFGWGVAVGTAIAQKRIEDTAAIEERLDLLADNQVKHGRAIEMLADNQDAVIGAINGITGSPHRFN